MSKIAFFLMDTSGASAAEYGLLLGLISVAIIASVTTFGGAVLGLYDNAIKKLSGAAG